MCVCRSTTAAEAVLASNGWNECGCWLPEDDSNGSMAGGPGGSLASPSCVGCRLTLATRVVHDLDGWMQKAGPRGACEPSAAMGDMRRQPHLSA